jgi:predicted nucleic acid-binding protein
LIVVDASAALAALLGNGPARRFLAEEQLHAPHLIDSEVASGLRRAVATGRLTSTEGWTVLDTWRRLGLTRYAVAPLLDRIWGLRENLSCYDAGYVGLAESLNCTLLTADVRLSHAPGIVCPVTVVPR